MSEHKLPGKGPDRTHSTNKAALFGSKRVSRKRDRSMSNRYMAMNKEEKMAQRRKQYIAGS